MAKVSRRSIASALITLPVLMTNVASVFSENAPASVPPAPPPVDPARALLHSTVLISSIDKSGNTRLGTGFIFALFSFKRQGVTVLVTNKHVIQDSVVGRLVFTAKKLDGSPNFGNNINLRVDAFETKWILHPDKDVDLAVLTLEPYFHDLRSAGRDPYYSFVDASSIPTEAVLNSYSPIQDVVVVGYPDGISDLHDNIPVVRRGITATPAYLNFNGKDQFLIDAAIFQGSSGSPVFLYNNGIIMENGSISFGTRISLLGVVFAVAQDSPQGPLEVIPAPTKTSAPNERGAPNNLGVCIAARRILDFERLLVAAGFKAPEGYVMRSNYP